MSGGDCLAVHVAGRTRKHLTPRQCNLIPRPSAASFLFAYVTFEPLSDKLPACLSDKGSKVTYATKNEAADGLGTRLVPACILN